VGVDRGEHDGVCGAEVAARGISVKASSMCVLCCWAGRGSSASPRPRRRGAHPCQGQGLEASLELRVRVRLDAADHQII
jgi:hypothetical protein